MTGSLTQTDADTWFRKCQMDAVTRNGVVPEWFHGIISRKTSEELLMCKPPGYFLIRVSESRIGYTLTYRAKDRCRHFMIDPMKDGYIILGDDRHHRLLEDLVDFHRKFPIEPFSDLLTMPCGQISHVTDYEELLFPQRHQQMSTPKDVPPVLPFRPTDAQPSRLYPSLHEALSRFYLAPTVSAPSQPPELPSRNVNPAKFSENQPCIRTKSGPPSHPKDHRDPFDSLTSIVTNLKKFKKKLHKNPNPNCSSEQAVSEEICVNTEVKPEANPCAVTADPQIVHAEHLPYSCIAIGAALPHEYLPPPPFAPGYN
ncbi:hematopoietic SH2 domain-containing protein homolog [Eucyclogobius newberryi]|uniref:hematopoietic SH2 domain-containing protein homolog n=1 Tax=Eucyclogobius newberryi TaxID=166745 RepID=UPI003B5BF387